MGDDFKVPMRMRMALVVLAYGGRAPSRALRRIARSAGYHGRLGLSANGVNKGSVEGKAVADFTKNLRRDGLLIRDGDDWVAPDIPALMDWVGDYLDRTLEYAESRIEEPTP